MRSILISSLVLCVVACGGASKPAESPSDNSASDDAGAPAKTGSDDNTTTTAAADAGSPAPAPSSGSSSGDLIPAGPTHPQPTATGQIDSKGFSPVMAHVSGKPHADGRIMVTLDETVDCTATSDSSISMLITYKDGYKSDLGSLKRGGKKSAGEIAFQHPGASGKKEFSTTFKPTGTVTIVKTAADANTPGRIKLDLTSGGYMLNGDADIQLCEPLTPISSDSGTKPAAGKKGTKGAKPSK